MIDIIRRSSNSVQEGRVGTRGPAHALGQSFFFLTMKGKILNFLHEVEKMISIISVQV